MIAVIILSISVSVIVGLWAGFALARTPEETYYKKAYKATIARAENMRECSPYWWQENKVTLNQIFPELADGKPGLREWDVNFKAELEDFDYRYDRSGNTREELAKYFYQMGRNSI